MGRKGFTLMEVLIGLFLLGLISVTILPIINSSLINLSKNNIRMEMNYIGEVVVERIKAFNEDETLDLYLYDTNVFEIIDLFRKNDNAQFNLSKENNGIDYLINIIKSQESDKLWKIAVYVYHDREESNINHVEYKAYLPIK